MANYVILYVCNIVYGLFKSSEHIYLFKHLSLLSAENIQNPIFELSKHTVCYNYRFIFLGSNLAGVNMTSDVFSVFICNNYLSTLFAASLDIKLMLLFKIMDSLAKVSVQSTALFGNS